MAGDRELPPLRVKLYGDNTDFKRMMTDSAALVSQLSSSLMKVNATVLFSAIKGTTDELRKMANISLANQVKNTKQFADNLERARKALDYINKGLRGSGGGNFGLGTGAWALAGASLGRSAAQAIASVAPVLMAAVRSAGTVAASVVNQSGQVLRAMINGMSGAVQQGIRAAAPAFANMFRSVAKVIATGIQQAGRVAAQAITQAGRLASTAIVQAARMFSSATNLASTAIRTAGSMFSAFSRGLSSTLSTFIRSFGQVMNTGVRGLGTYMNTLARNSRSSSSRGGGGGGSSYSQFGGLGDRADIYMHANAIRTLIDMSSSFIASSANWQRMSVQLETLTGSAAEATKVMERLRKEALESPYDMQGLMDSARTMMAYGASVDQAQDVTKMLGDVAGGSNEKLSRLSLGMAQIISLGKLQGNELRQLTEHGFNPLRTIAERTLKPMQTMEERMRELNEAKEKGRITSDMVVKALEIETSAGGRFAGMAYRMSQDVWGLTQQIQELVTLIKKRFMDTLLKDTQNALRVVIDFLKKVDAWAQANEELVATIARVARNVMVAAVVFNMLGMAIAMTKWQLRMASMIFAFFGTVVNTVTGAVRALRIGLIALALNNPVGWIVIAIGAALALGAAIMHPGGPVGAFKAFMAWGQTAVQNVIGFFYNFQENVAIIGAWLSANWGKLFIGMVSMSVRIFTVFMTWLIAYLPMKAWEAGTYFMGKLIDAVSFGLQKLGEMFSFFWANITNPAAILEYLSKFTSTLAGDISTTMSDGLVGGITKVMSEELAALNLPELNLKGPEYKAPAEPTPPDLPTAPDVDFNGMMGPGGGGRAATPVTAVRAGSGEAATMAHQYMMGRAAKRAGGDPQLEVNKEQRDLLRIIAQNTRGTKDDMRLDNAGLVGPQVA